jgi:hypothetical protein
LLLNAPHLSGIQVQNKLFFVREIILSFRVKQISKSEFDQVTLYCKIMLIKLYDAVSIVLYINVPFYISIFLSISGGWMKTVDPRGM